MDIDRYEELAKAIFFASLEVHKIMGPGLLESVYEICLLKELQLRNISAETQVGIPLQFKGFDLSKEYRIDILVEKEIIIELKSIDIILPVHHAQIISYLKLADKRMGFLINFNVPIIKSGFKRFVNNY
ncbi:GxxExxY protein [Flavobacterium glaciei]|uniref:GxxExxY protein n=1 Tax=Flavobacterium glaciei TaxID=386300 RepID=A0A562PJR8_9FLAO|nr:GxxExxY protein [Flavobacterium glaciei]RDI51282.1 GxxExxY protein [Flavobacterium glaciei]TWI44573.1 GxxExxY protein [Flavobacterium glaciei]